MTVPAPPKRDNRQRRHSTATMQIARRMYGNGSLWTPTQIRNYLVGQGISVSLNTIRMWVIPGAAEEQRVLNLASYHRRRRETSDRAKHWTFGLAGPGGKLTAAYRAAFVLRLRAEGVPRSSIAKVCTVVFDEPVTRRHVCAILGEPS